MRNFIAVCINTMLDLILLIYEYFVDQDREIELSDEEMHNLVEEGQKIEEIVEEHLDLEAFDKWAEAFQQQDIQQYGKAYPVIVYYVRTMKLLKSLKDIETEHDSQK